MSKALRTAIHQVKPFASLEQEVYLGIRFVARMLRDPWAHFLKSREDLSLSQYNLLRILRGAGKKGLPVGTIAKRMINRDPDVTRLVDRLLKRGYLVRERDENDRRVVHVNAAFGFPGEGTAAGIGSAAGAGNREEPCMAVTDSFAQAPLGGAPGLDVGVGVSATDLAIRVPPCCQPSNVRLPFELPHLAQQRVPGAVLRCVCV